MNAVRLQCRQSLCVKRLAGSLTNGWRQIKSLFNYPRRYDASATNTFCWRGNVSETVTSVHGRKCVSTAVTCRALRGGARLLFTSCRNTCTWAGTWIILVLQCSVWDQPVRDVTVGSAEVFLLVCLPKGALISTIIQSRLLLSHFLLNPFIKPSSFSEPSGELSLGDFHLCLIKPCEVCSLSSHLR